jgi:hypothetical protein
MGALERIPGDRRDTRRYELRLDLRFSFEQDGTIRLGHGRTHDISHGGIRFETDCPPAPGTRVELRIAWPTLLQNVCALELEVRGIVARTNRGSVVLRMERYDFRTCGDRSFSLPVPAQPAYSVVA